MTLAARASTRSVARSMRRGLTLIELMVAVGIMSVMGLLLVSTLRGSSNIVSTATARGAATATAQSVLSRVEADLVQAYRGEGGRLVGGMDPFGRPFIAFVRALPEERRTLAGYYSGSSRPLDGEASDWRGMVADGEFRAFGGLGEVCYVMEPRRQTMDVYRGLIAPVGRTGAYGGWSRAAAMSTGLIGEMEDWHLGRGGPAAAPGVEGALKFEDKFQLVASKVLHLGFEYWSDDTRSWSDIGGMSDGPTTWWESAPSADLFEDLSDDWPERPVSAASLPHRNMGFPAAVRVTVVVVPDPPLDVERRVAAEVDVSATSIQLDSLEGVTLGRSRIGYLRIGDEWVSFTGMSGNSILGVERGRRGTRPSSHQRGTSVRGGIAFSRIVQLPVGR